MADLIKQLESEKAKHQAWLRQQPGFMGIGIGMGPDLQPSLKILTNQMPPETKQAIERRLASVPFHFDETGPLEAF